MASAELRRAVEIASEQLAGVEPRWTHVRAVGERAEVLCRDHELPDYLAAAAWLHDVGYGDDIVATGFHPLDGARFLRRIGSGDPVTSLVAYHSGLTASVAPFEPADPPVLKSLPLARGEDGQVHRVRILGAHLLIVGATGAGKGSVLWSLISALAAGIRDQLVQVWAIDPKGGMERAAGAPLFARFVYGDTPDGGDDTGYEVQFAQVLEDAVTVMRRRQSALRGRARLHTPTTAEPLIVVIIDELASLTAYINDRDAKRRIIAALSLLLSQGRAVGVSVVGAVQDPRKDIISMRDLFPTRILLRVTEPEHVALTLGQGARDRGATADLIDDATPGVAYIGQDGVPEAARVRFTHVTDDDITALVQQYAPRAAPMLPGAIPAVV
ncbi:FtsK/SpoIIIE domain-containing protein [Cellulomonas aerilata]|uniref:FtsK domain-containing protein n=1 Tax=Cellulomonas aerilata TaxID=515326 RepID=A0A512D779_9CELL|nr:FtsK/SpoIIIE domain-containing protein [Cellulomonas aerilata]GEO32331.1 hypothetical protein CAE01nite_00560 [Cellulomonas aerilata]